MNTLESIYLALFVCILIQAIRLTTVQGKFCAYFLLASISIFELIEKQIESALGFYAGAALINLLVVIVTSQINPIPSMLPKLHIVCLISIVFNALGYLLWYLYYEPFLYDISFVVIYMYTIILLNDRDMENDTRDNRKSFSFHFNLSKVFLCMPNRKRKI